MSVKTAPTEIEYQSDADLPTEDEIHETFETLGLLTTGPTGYAYLSPWGTPASGRVFDVIRTTTSAPRGA